MSVQQRLSVDLYEALEVVGASESVRRLHQLTSTELEIILTLLHMVIPKDGQTRQYHMCGSRYEGSVTPDLASDTDMIICDSHIRVVLDPTSVPQGQSFLMVKDYWTYPGYVKLQSLLDGQSHCDLSTVELDDISYDIIGRLCLEHRAGYNTQGPANEGVDEKGKHFGDAVFAYICENIPDHANTWIHRQRKHGWPSAQMLEKMSTMGCIVVRVGYWKSPERDLEWRMSFSLQERLLMSSLNATQHKVYILLKMIKKSILGKSIDEESLTSYHCKTCIFHALEKTPSAFWCPENLIRCLLLCLRLLLHWVDDNYCPNYFIPEQNLFSKESFLRTRDQIKYVLQVLIDREHRFLFWIDTDCIDEILMDGPNSMATRSITDVNKHNYILERKFEVISHSMESVLRSLVELKDPLLTLGVVQSHTSIGKYTESQIKNTKYYLLPWLHLYSAKYLASSAIDKDDRDSFQSEMNIADEHFVHAARTDVSSLRLAQASILYTNCKYEECMALLQEIENDLTFRVFTFCPCQEIWICQCEKEQQQNDLVECMSQMPATYIQHNHISSCVVFSRSESSITPAALRYEMYRSLDSKPGSRDSFDHWWFDFAVCDARIYLHFLKYLLFSKLQIDVRKQTAVYNLKMEIDRCNASSETMGEALLAHKETAYNLLGWIYLQENNIFAARKCYRESFKLRPINNAAKLQIDSML